jgi:hypothetical protein
MNPGDFILLILSLAFAAVSLVAHGWTVNGIGPALLSTAGGLWQLWMQWLRHRSWLRHKDEGFAPSTQHLAISAWLGWSLGVFAAVIWTILTLKELRP